MSNADSGGILTVGILGAIWSSSAAVVAIVGSLNRAYDIEEGRPWWKVRLTAIGLTVALAAMILDSFTLIVVGPTVAEHLAASFGFGAVFEWTWKILQWPLAFFLVSTAVGLVYYFAPDAEQDWVWITPGAIVGTVLWVIVSLVFKVYVANFADYNATWSSRRRDRPPFLVLHFRTRHPRRRRNERRDRARVPCWEGPWREGATGRGKKIGAARRAPTRSEWQRRRSAPLLMPSRGRPRRSGDAVIVRTRENRLGVNGAFNVRCTPVEPCRRRREQGA